MSRLKTQEQMEKLRASYQALGYLQMPSRKDWMHEIRLPGGCLVVAVNWGGDCWETFKASGTVYVNYFAIQRMVMLSDDVDNTTLKVWQLLVGPLRLNWAFIREQPC